MVHASQGAPERADALKCETVGNQQVNVVSDFGQVCSFVVLLERIFLQVPPTNGRAVDLEPVNRDPAEIRRGGQELPRFLVPNQLQKTATVSRNHYLVLEWELPEPMVELHDAPAALCL